VQAWPLEADGTTLHVGPPRRLTRWPFTGENGTLVAAADGKLAANLRDQGTVQLLDPADPEHAVPLAGHMGATNHVTASPDGRWVAARTAGDAPDKLRVSEVRTGKIVWSPPCDRGGAQFSPDSRHLVTSSDRCCIWTTGSWELVREIPPAPGLGNARYAVYAPDGITLAIAYENSTIRLVDARSGAELAALPAPELPMIGRLAFSADGSRLAGLMDNVGVQVWDLRELRARLAELGLDWDAPPLPAAAPVGPALAAARVRHNEAPPTPLSAPFDADEAARQQQAWAWHLDVPLEITNTIGMRLKLIPPGEYRPGQYTSDRGASKVPYYLGTYEVTAGHFRRFVQETKYRTSAEASGKGGVDQDSKKVGTRKPEFIWSNPRFAPTENHPVVMVSRNDMVAFCDWLSRKEGATYRLPTFDEWRWAALAGTPNQFHFGDVAEQVNAHYWHVGNSGLRTHAVGEKKSNPWGLFDMYGNVWEHVSDWATQPGMPPAPPVHLPNMPKRPWEGDKLFWIGGGYWDVVRTDHGWLFSVSEAYAHFGFRVVLAGEFKAPARR
jgi:formylglycine-generating enzyme required for sulfatase activity